VKHNYYAHYKAEREAHNRQFALAVEQCTALVKRMDVEASQHTAKVQLSLSLKHARNLRVGVALVLKGQSFSVNLRLITRHFSVPRG